MPTISVIVPVYNVEKYIHRCVDSILNQTFTDFELILVDDGSPDNCGAICDEYAAKDSRVRVIHQENGGLSAARNAGIDAAVGKYIMFCDSDDYVSAQWCEIMLRGVELYPRNLVCSNLRKVLEWENAQERVFLREQMRELTYYQLVRTGLSGYSCNKIFSSSVIRENQLRFDEQRKFAEDVPFVIDYCAFVSGFTLIDVPLYYYLQREGSLLHSQRSDILEHQLFTFFIRIPYISDEDIPEYCDAHLYSFIHYFDAVFIPENKAPIWKKFHYNQRMLQSEAFCFCVKHATGKNENPLVLRILRTHNYYLFWLFDQLVKLKAKLRRNTQ